MASYCCPIGGLVREKKADYKAEMKFYEDACRNDPSIQSFDANLQARTTRVINTVVAGVDIRSLSFESLKEITGGLLETNQEVVQIILDYKKDIWKNKELFQLVEDYFTNSLRMLDFCTAMEKCLRRARDRQLIIRFALQLFEEENDGNGVNKEDKYSKTLEELQRFKIEEDPFTEEFFQILNKVQDQQRLMLMKLKRQNDKINKKLKSLKAWRRLSGIIFVTAFVAIVICSVVTAAVAAPPIAAALTAAISVPLGSVGKWFDSLWKRYQVALEREGELINSLQVRSIVAIWDLDSIRALVDKLEMQIESLMRNADFALRGDDAVKFGIEEIKKNMEMFKQSLEDLSEHASKCSDHIMKGRTAILQKIIKYEK